MKQNYIRVKTQSNKYVWIKETELNIKNGSGRDSIVMIYSGEVDETHHGNTNTGDSATLLGEANNNTGNRALLTGNLNDNEAANALFGGNSNKIYEEGTNSTGGGYENEINAPNTGTVGHSNVNNGKNTLMGGEGNTNEAPDSMVGGLDNTNTGDRSVLGGRENDNSGKSAILGGFRNINHTDDAVGAGHYNLPVEDALLFVGNGDSEETRSNAFLVYEDGRAYVQTAPQNENDVVRKIELDEVKSDIENVKATIPKNEYKIVEVLPDATSSTSDGIYLILEDATEDRNVYSEYITVKEDDAYRWEKIGSSELKLSVDDALSSDSENPVQNKVIAEALSKTVTTDTNQTITGRKTFKETITFEADAGDIILYGEPNENGYVEPILYFNGPFGTTAFKRNSITNRSGGDVQTFTFPEESGTLTTEEKVEDLLGGYVPEFSDDFSAINKFYLVCYNQNKKTAIPITMYDSTDATRPATGFAVFRTDANGGLKVGTPNGDYHATPKVYVDKGMWLPAYDATVTYAKDVMVVKDGKIYKSLIDSNTGNALTDTASWEDLLSGKLDKVSNVVYYDRVYAVRGNGEQALIGASGEATQYRLPIYMPSGYVGEGEKFNAVLKVGTPIVSNDATNKDYVDEQIASVKKYYKHRVTFDIYGTGGTLDVEIIDSSPTKYTADTIQAGETGILNYAPISGVCDIRNNTVACPATLLLSSGNLSATVYNDNLEIVPNAVITFLNDNVTEI